MVCAYRTDYFGKCGGAFLLVITCDEGTNVVLLENGRISIVQADCPDKLCVEQGAITTGGVPIVCLPHKLYINITDDSGETL